MNYPKASGDYYFDRSIAPHARAKAVYFSRLKKTVPYHHRVEAGEVPPNLPDCVLVIGEPSTSHSGAHEIPEMDFAPHGAMLYFDKFLSSR